MSAEPSAAPLVVLVNLGTPRSPATADVRAFLREFLADRRVVDLPRWVWRPIPHGIILPLRPRRSARLYASVWRDDGPPLKVHSAALTAGVAERLGHQVEVRLAMTYGEPNLRDVLTEAAAGPARQVIVVPLYPQYAGSASGAVHDVVHRWGLAARRHVDLRVLGSFPEHPAYVDAVATAVTEHWARVGPLDLDAGERLVLSYHGVPVSHVRRGDPYLTECAATTAALVARLGLPAHGVVMTFQSRFGPGAWLTPATIDTMRRLGGAGTGRVDVVAPGFAADCLETIEELDGLNRHAFTGAGGGQFHYVPWANAAPACADALATIIGDQIPRAGAGSTGRGPKDAALLP